MRQLALLAVALILLGVTGYLIGRFFPAEKTARGRSRRWHGVAVCPSGNACESARRLWNMRYRSREAPRLPLADCNRRPCRCRYIHFVDQRAGERRLPSRHPPPGPVVERRRAHRRSAQPRGAC